jgi:hypothetical protein
MSNCRDRALAIGKIAYYREKVIDFTEIYGLQSSRAPICGAEVAAPKQMLAMQTFGPQIFRSTKSLPQYLQSSKRWYMMYSKTNLTVAKNAIQGVAAFALFLLGAVPASAQSDVYLNAQMPWHAAELDTQGKVLAWFQPEKNLGYDHFLRLDWSFLEHKVPIDSVTGVKVYLTAPIFDGVTLQGVSWQHNPPSTYAHLMDSLVGWYAYSADNDAVPVMREMLDYQLAHGTSPAGWDWAGVPFATSCLHDKEYGRCLRDLPLDHYGGIETDKIGEMGLAYVNFYELTGERKYLEAGIRCADQLAKHIRAGDATHTPWPWRVEAKSGAVIDKEEYGGLIAASVRLFDELIKISEGDSPKYKKARDISWNWVLNNPLNKQSGAYDNWNGYYEDVEKDTVNQNDMDSIVTAYYILSQDDPSTVDRSWREDVGHLIDRSRELLGRGPFFGAWAIDEQLRPDGGITGASSEETTYATPRGPLFRTYGRGCCSRAGLVCRTSQWGAINAMFFAKTHDGQAREDAFRSLNYATYFAESDGKINCCGLDFKGSYWFEDGYSDAGRSFMWALGAIADFAPIGQDHILHSTTVVQKVTYERQRVTYKTFSPTGTELLRLSYKPTRVTAGDATLTTTGDTGAEGYDLKPLAKGDYEVTLRHLHSGMIAISGN